MYLINGIKSRSLFFCLMLFPFLLSAQSRYAYSKTAMGSKFNLIFYAPSDSIAQIAADSVFKQIDYLNTILSDYLDGSETNRLSATAGTNQWFKASPILFEVVNQSLRLSKQTNGAFDATIGPVIQLWRRALRRSLFPDTAEIKTTQKLVGYQKVKLRPHSKEILLKQKGMRLDFGGIGKGYAADRALLVLRHYGITKAFLDAGGDLTLADAPPHKEGWSIEINTGGADTTYRKIMFLHNCGIATSGQTYRYLEHNGIRYSHIVNPKTGIGLINHTRTTVIAPNGTDADALATAFSVLGVVEGAKVVKKLKDVQVWLLEQNGTSWKTSAFEQ